MTRALTTGLAMAVIAAGLSGCKGPTNTASAAAPSSATVAASVAAPVVSAPAAPGITVTITLSPAAASQLAAHHQTVTLPAEFYGVPTDPKLRDQVEGRLDVGPEVDVVLNGAGTGTIVVPPLDAAKVSQLEDGAVLVAIDVSSGNHTTDDNLLNCDALMDVPLKQAESQPITINCKAIGEP